MTHVPSFLMISNQVKSQNFCNLYRSTKKKPQKTRNTSTLQHVTATEKTNLLVYRLKLLLPNKLQKKTLSWFLHNLECNHHQKVTHF